MHGNCGTMKINCKRARILDKASSESGKHCFSTCSHHAVCVLGSSAAPTKVRVRRAEDTTWCSGTAIGRPQTHTHHLARQLSIFSIPHQRRHIFRPHSTAVNELYSVTKLVECVVVSFRFCKQSGKRPSAQAPRSTNRLKPNCMIDRMWCTLSTRNPCTCCPAALASGSAARGDVNVRILTKPAIAGVVIISLSLPRRSANGKWK
ncbi:hypothetical protein TRVL_07784 [Trypanosoma vivax]|nr:hypothetical protein TRVL_07784 [Trypanosoma vivax]